MTLLLTLGSLLLTILLGVLKNIWLWLDYNDTYIRIQSNPYLKHRMKHDPGVRFMRNGWIIVGILLAILSAQGLMQ